MKAEIGYGGSGEKEWEQAGHQVTFRFTKPEYRERFISDANRLLAGHWEELIDATTTSPSRRSDRKRWGGGEESEENCTTSCGLP